MYAPTHDAHPAATRRAAVSQSRATLRRIFVRYHFAFDFGALFVNLAYQTSFFWVAPANPPLSRGSSIKTFAPLSTNFKPSRAAARPASSAHFDAAIGARCDAHGEVTRSCPFRSTEGSAARLVAQRLGGRGSTSLRQRSSARFRPGTLACRLNRPDDLWVISTQSGASPSEASCLSLLTASRARLLPELVKLHSLRNSTELSNIGGCITS